MLNDEIVQWPPGGRPATRFDKKWNPVAGSTIAEGEFIEKEKSLSGNWSIEQSEGKRYIVLAADFKARKGPDLKIFLSPRSIDSVNGKTAIKGSALVANLKEIKAGKYMRSLMSSISLNTKAYSSIAKSMRCFGAEERL